MVMVITNTSRKGRLHLIYAECKGKIKIYFIIYAIQCDASRLCMLFLNSLDNSRSA